MFKTIWQYKVKTKNINSFREAYNSSGDWVKLFNKANGFLGTQLMQNTNEQNTFVTIDTWETEKHFLDFKNQFKKEYKELDEKFEILTVNEVHIGTYSVV